MSGIVVDSSAVIAILEGENDGDRLGAAFLAASPRWMGALTLAECAMVLERRRGPLGKAGLDTFVTRFGVRIAEMDEAQAREAHRAYAAFGKGRHPAALNLGDCCAYACARALGLPLLQRGEDFPRTDLPLVAW